MTFPKIFDPIRVNSLRILYHTMKNTSTKKTVLPRMEEIWAGLVRTLDAPVTTTLVICLRWQIMAVLLPSTHARTNKQNAI